MSMFSRSSMLCMVTVEGNTYDRAMRSTSRPAFSAMPRWAAPIPVWRALMPFRRRSARSPASAAGHARSRASRRSPPPSLISCRLPRDPRWAWCCRLTVAWLGCGCGHRGNKPGSVAGRRTVHDPGTIGPASVLGDPDRWRPASRRTARRTLDLVDPIGDRHAKLHASGNSRSSRNPLHQRLSEDRAGRCCLRWSLPRGHGR